MLCEGNTLNSCVDNSKFCIRFKISLILPLIYPHREQDEYNGDGDGEDRVREAQQIEKKERITLIKQQFALRRKGAQRGGSSGSSSSYASRLKEQKEKEKLEKEEKERANRSKLTNAEYTSKISGLNVGVSSRVLDIFVIYCNGLIHLFLLCLLPFSFLSFSLFFSPLFIPHLLCLSLNIFPPPLHHLSHNTLSQ